MDQHTNEAYNALARRWLERAILARDSHYKQGKVMKKRHTAIGIATCIITTVVGSSIFLSMSHSSNAVSNIIFGTLSIVAAVLAGLQTFLNLSERSEKHRATAIRFSSIVRRLEIIIYSGNNELGAIKRSLEEVRKEWDSINLDSPLAPMKVWLPTLEEIKKQQQIVK